MVEHDDASHYEVSLTAGQAFTGVLLMLGSLVAAFAFGIVIGTARAEDQRVREVSSPVLDEEVADPVEAFAIEEEREPVAAREQADEPESALRQPALTVTEAPPRPERRPEPVIEEQPEEMIPHVAQLLSTTDGEQAEALAATLIEEGYETAFVERVPRTDGSMLYRVRVRFDSESAARRAESALERFSPTGIWIAPGE